LVGSSDP